MEAETTVKLTIAATLAEWQKVVEDLRGDPLSYGVSDSSSKLIELIEGEE